MRSCKPLLLVGLVFLFLVSALGVIISKHHSRLLFIEIQTLGKKLDKQEIEWGRLQLELTMLTEENRVERVAKEQLKLIMPERKKFVYIKPKQ